MKVKMILPALTEATSPLFRPIKYSLFPPLGLATLAAYLEDSDEIVIADEHLLEKPLDHADAVRMLRILSGRAHQVTTAVSLVKPNGQSDTRSCNTRVFFRTLDDEEIQRYVASNEPMDKAGAYAIQGGAACFADRMEGEYSNVVGLPLPLVAEMLRANGFS